MISLVFGIPAGAEWIILVLALLLIFGGTRIAGIGKGTGRAVREFKEEINAIPGKNPAPGTTVEPDPVRDEVEVKAPVANPTDPR